MPRNMENLTYGKQGSVDQLATNDEVYHPVVRRGAREASMQAVAATVQLIDDEVKLAWQKDALCAQTDPEAFFPEKGGSTKNAKEICNTCDSKDECLAYALKNDERFGIWGGLSERERRKLQKSTDVTS